MNTYYAFIIAATLIGFCGLAWLLLAPIWRFLDREEKASERWTEEALARRRRRQSNGHEARRGSSTSGDPAPPDEDAPGSPSDDEKD
jgi:hypothetical protein